MRFVFSMVCINVLCMVCRDMKLCTKMWLDGKTYMERDTFRQESILCVEQICTEM